MYYARLTVKKAQANMGRKSLEATSMRECEQIGVGSRLVTQIVKDDGIPQLAINSDMWVSKTTSTTAEDPGSEKTRRTDLIPENYRARPLLRSCLG